MYSTFPLRKILFHLLLFVATFFTTTLAGVQWINKNPFDLNNFWLGLPFSISVLLFLTAHEFGHFFAARFHNVQTTLPFYIPVPPMFINPFGTMGAVIRIRSEIQSRNALFDIGIAGPLAGLAVAFVILFYGIATMPGKEFIYEIHPDYVGKSLPEGGLTFGSSLFFYAVSNVISLQQYFPPMNEMYHYPYLCAAWFGFFVTALNLIPVGQLDGGHILYALLGKKQGIIARGFLIVLVLISLSGFLPFFSFGTDTMGWLLWVAILFFIIKPDHPPVAIEEPLDNSRKLLGWTTLVFFIAIFIPVPLLNFGV
ncbi:MAG: site-2 protease family protein [Ignavibacteria bacterium]|nr:site-2 protease family protein [Ignavibacteria bacterium]